MIIWIFKKMNLIKIYLIQGFRYIRNGITNFNLYMFTRFYKYFLMVFSSRVEKLGDCFGA